MCGTCVHLLRRLQHESYMGMSCMQACMQSLRSVWGWELCSNDCARGWTVPGVQRRRQQCSDRVQSLRALCPCARGAHPAHSSAPLPVSWPSHGLPSNSRGGSLGIHHAPPPDLLVTHGAVLALAGGLGADIAVLVGAGSRERKGRQGSEARRLVCGQWRNAMEWMHE